MINASSSSKIWPVFLFVLVIGVFAGCNSDQASSVKKEEKLLKAKAGKMSETQLFLNYIDSVTKLPLKDFNEDKVQGLNQKFADQLPLVMYDASKEPVESIVVQLYRNKAATDTVKSGAVILVPRHLTDSLRVADFTGYFGKLKKEKPLIGITAQPLPVQIDLFSGTALQLTFNDHEKPEQAHVITVEILKYK